MSKKKRFGISAALTRGLSETINVVENNTGQFRNVILPLSRIELDPDNPRKLALNIADIRDGINTDGPTYLQKQAELEKIKELAHTIKSSGVINPIVVYKLGEIYRVVAGERRCLASIYAGKQEIEARVFTERPKSYDLKLIQWIENTAREDLTLDERLGNVRDIVHEYQIQHDNPPMTATLLKTITGLSLPQCSYYVAVLNSPADLMLEIKNGHIRNLDKAALIAGIKHPSLRAEAIYACTNGASLKELRALAAQEKVAKKSNAIKFPVKLAAGVKVSLGAATPGAVQILMEAVADKEAKFANLMRDTNWAHAKQVAKKFRQLIQLLEQENIV